MANVEQFAVDVRGKTREEIVDNGHTYQKIS